MTEASRPYVVIRDTDDADEASRILRNHDLPHEVLSRYVVDAELLRQGRRVTVATTAVVTPDGTQISSAQHLQDMLEEPVLQPNPLRFTLFPLAYPELHEFYEKALASFWTHHEVSLADDVHDWQTKLTEDDRTFIKHVLAFFAGSDGIVMENLAANFACQVQIPEARQFYAAQMLQEAVHSSQYALLIDALAGGSAEALRLFRAIETIPAVRKKASWAQRWMAPERRFAERLVAFVCVEGVLFSGSFCAIYWLKRRGVMPGLCLSNEFISRDEALHYAFGIALFKTLRRRPDQGIVHDIVREAVETELDFVKDAIPCRLVGMNADLMQEYIRFVADRALVDLGYDKLYDVANPFPWMDLIALQGKVNFFERLPSEYQRAGVMAGADEQVFATDGDF
jgi:ribonucleotide reductase beta subunit family protein with ferritin-like domain